MKLSTLKRIKASLLAAAAVVTVIATATAQQGGTVNFGNHSGSKVINGQTGLPVAAGHNVHAALYWAPLGSETFVQLGDAVSVGVPLPGLFVGGTRAAGPATLGGSTGQFQVRAWEGTDATYEAALLRPGVLIGQSAVVTVETGDPAASPPTPPASLLAGDLAGFTLIPNSSTIPQPGIAVTKECPPQPVPPGGTLFFTGTVTNTGNVPLTEVRVVSDQPVPNTVVFRLATLEPGARARFMGSYRVASCSGPFVDTVTAWGFAPDGVGVTNSITTSCPGTNAVAVAGDMNGDGLVDQTELNQVLANYWASSQWVCMTNATSQGGGIFQFALTNATAWNFTVLASTNLLDWTPLSTPAYPVYQFYDPEAAAKAPMRAYRLRWP